VTPFEALLAFLVVMGAISVPLVAVINRSSSPIGRAIAERIRRRTERRYGPDPTRDRHALSDAGRRPYAPRPGLPESPDPGDARDPSALIEAQQQELREMGARLEFLERLLEDREPRPRE